MKLERPIMIVGAGSIGRRHARNLKILGHDNILFFRTQKSTLPDDGIADIWQEFNLSAALARRPIATIISNPTALHIPMALAAASVGSHLFIEKPISHNLDGIEELKRLSRRNKLVVQTGFQFRFHPALKKIKRDIDASKIGKVVGVQAHWGEYLPDWHPWEDYRISYSARADLGGGVIATLCHPFDYLRWLLGEVESVSAITNNRALGLGVEDTADVLLKFKSGVIGNVHLDYIQKPTEHYFRVVGTRGTIGYNFEKSKYERNKLFLAEMRDFLLYIERNGMPKCTIDDGVAALKIILAAKESAQKKRWIKIK